VRVTSAYGHVTPRWGVRVSQPRVSYCGTTSANSLLVRVSYSGTTSADQPQLDDASPSVDNLP